MHRIKVLIGLGSVLLLASCAGRQPTEAPALNPTDARALIEASLPKNVRDRAGWAVDMYGAFTVLTVTPNHENICAVVAVIEQESGFRVDPAVPGLGVIARKEINSRAARAHVPMLILDGVLQLKSSDGRSYGERIDAAKTEKDLSDAYEDLLAAVPLGRTLFSDRNPIRTRGPMQVNVAFAEQFSAAAPYPYPVKVSIEDELFTRRGGVYFGVAHLLDYRAPYDQYLYRFADFNAGQYASRNAAFQSAVSVASGIPLVADGALLPHGSDANNPGDTELAVRALAARLKMSDGAIHAALAEGKTKEFETTTLYQRVFALADQKAGMQLPPALVPRIKLVGPKIKRRLTTDWYAHRVDDRFKRCLNTQQ
ncbi:MAG: hypothetical protein QOD95_3382 [Gammaproteobacteria bacterium]|jgi:hypothetical protein|nr:hypothetical protein [Gammaproteobacteria bacterium]